MINIFLGDCVETLGKEIYEDSIDLTITSPPYDNLRTYNGYGLLWNEQKWKEVIKELFRVTKSGGVVVWVVADATIDGSETGTSFKQALWAKECGFNLHDTMIWQKQTFTDTGSLRTRYGGVHEYMFIWSKGKPKTFNPIKDRPTKGVRKKHGTVRQPDGTTKPQSSLGKIYDNKFAQRFNVWQINTETSNKNRFHPAQFPEKLVYDHIISWSNEGDVVLDPFMGSGTTGKISKQLNRQFVGIEIDKGFFEIAKTRI